MEPENSPIGKHFRDAFADFKREPSPDLWDKIARHPEFPKPNSRPAIGKLAFLGLGIAGIVILSILAFYRMQDTPEVNRTVETVSIEKPGQGTHNHAANQTRQDIPLESVNRVSPKTLPSSTQDNPGKGVPVKPRSHTDIPTAVSIPEVSPIPAVQASAPVQTKPALHSSGLKSTTRFQDSELSAKPGSSEPLSISSDTMLCRGESLTLEARGGDIYSWNTGETTSAVLVNPTETTVYSVTATSHNGRQLIREIQVKVVDCKKLNIANAFTPNADGVNDIFEVFGNDILDYYIIILSRTGQVVYESKDLKSGWDGSVKGKPAELGVYIYRIEYKDLNGVTHKQSGQITLLR